MRRPQLDDKSGHTKCTPTAGMKLKAARAVYRDMTKSTGLTTATHRLYLSSVILSGRVCVCFIRILTAPLDNACKLSFNFHNPRMRTGRHFSRAGRNSNGNADVKNRLQNGINSVGSNKQTQKRNQKFVLACKEPFRRANTTYYGHMKVTPRDIWRPISTLNFFSTRGRGC